MAKNWYPVVDITSCIECGTCVDNCGYDVFDKARSPVPHVISPLNCMDHCYKCGNNCMVAAITYVGDDTSWIPPALVHEDVGAHLRERNCRCGCGCSCGNGER